MKKKRVVVTLAACGLIAAMGVGSTIAYLTDHSEATNHFTFGNVTVDVLEPDWDTTDSDNNGIPDAAENVVPNQVVKKSVKAKNIGINDAVVFVRITVPLENVTRVSDNGTAERKSDGSLDRKLQEVFYFQDADDTINKENNNFDPAWVNIPEEEIGYAGAGSNNEYLDLSTTREYSGNTRTYVFGYNKRIAKDEETTLLFDKVQIKNYVENEINPLTTKDIKVETFSIQADNIVDENGAIDTTGTLGHDTLKEIYDIYVTQNPDRK